MFRISQGNERGKGEEMRCKCGHEIVVRSGKWQHHSWQSCRNQEQEYEVFQTKCHYCKCKKPKLAEATKKVV